MHPCLVRGIISLTPVLTTPAPAEYVSSVVHTLPSPSIQMVIPGADYTGPKATPDQIAEHTVTALRRWGGGCVCGGEGGRGESVLDGAPRGRQA